MLLHGAAEIILSQNTSYRFTASLIELLRHADNLPRHRILTECARRISGFTITDTLDLEAEEGEIPPVIMDKIDQLVYIGMVKRLLEDVHRMSFPLSIG